MSDQQFTIEHLPEEYRYVLRDTHTTDASGTALEIGEEAYVDVASDHGTERVLYHTGVSEDYGGQGLASTLVQAAVDDILGAGQKIVPVCPYVVKWLDKNDQYAEHVVKAKPHHLQAVKSKTQS